jgi:hypothetical protein
MAIPIAYDLVYHYIISDSSITAVNANSYTVGKGFKGSMYLQPASVRLGAVPWRLLTVYNVGLRQ